jgi:hypothetical protein
MSAPLAARGNLIFRRGRIAVRPLRAILLKFLIRLLTFHFIRARVFCLEYP